MNIPLFAAMLVGATLTAFPARLAQADDTAPAPAATASAATAPSTDAGTTDDAKGKKGEKLKEALAKLNLSDDQKAKIKEIITTETDKKVRRQKIAEVLTPEQKAKFKEMVHKHREAAGA